MMDRKNSKCDAFLSYFIDFGDENENGIDPNNSKIALKISNELGNDACQKCETCHEVFDNLNELKKHICQQRIKNEKTCKICNQDFESVRSLRKHKKNEHKNEEIFECEFCDDFFEDKQNLKIHYEEFHPSLLVCKICNRNFESGKALNRHIGIVHTEKKHECDYCEKGFTDSSKLNKHIKEFHINSKGEVFSKRNSIMIIFDCLGNFFVFAYF